MSQIKTTKKLNIKYLKNYFLDNYKIIKDYGMDEELNEFDYNSIKNVIDAIEKEQLKKLKSHLNNFFKYYYMKENTYEEIDILFSLQQQIDYKEYIDKINPTQDEGQFKIKLLYAIRNLLRNQNIVIRHAFNAVWLKKEKDVPMNHVPDKNVITYVKKIFDRYSQIDTQIANINNDKNLTNEEIDLISKLKKLSNIFFRNLFKSKIYNFMIYGSYSLYLLNHNIKFNDIDLYTNNPLLLMKLFAFVAKWGFDVDLTIVIVPLVKNYVTIKYKNQNIFDLIYFPKENFDNNILSNIKISGNKILNFKIQFLNFIHSLPDQHRIIKLKDSEKYNNNILKIALMLDKYLELTKISLVDLQKTELIIPKIKRINNNCIILNVNDLLLNKTLQSKLNFKKIIFVSSIQEEDFVELFSGIKVFYKTYKGIYNEISFVAKTKITGNVKKSISYVNGQLMYVNTQTEMENSLTTLINNNLPCLVITNNTARLFFQNEGEDELLLDYSLETLMSKFLLTSYFSHMDSELQDDFFKYFLLLINKSKLIPFNQENLITIEKFKTSSQNHKNFTPTNNYLKNLIYEFDPSPRKEFYSSLTEFKEEL